MAGLYGEERDGLYGEEDLCIGPALTSSVGNRVHVIWDNTMLSMGSQGSRLADTKVQVYDGFIEHAYRLVFEYGEKFSPSEPLLQTILPSGIVENEKLLKPKVEKGLCAYGYAQSIDPASAEPHLATPFVWRRDDGSLAVLQTWGIDVNASFKTEFETSTSNPNQTVFSPQAVDDFKRVVVSLFGPAAEQEPILYCHRASVNTKPVYIGTRAALLAHLAAHPEALAKISIARLTSDGFIATTVNGNGEKGEKPFALGEGTYAVYVRQGGCTMACATPYEQFVGGRDLGKELERTSRRVVLSTRFRAAGSPESSGETGTEVKTYLEERGFAVYNPNTDNTRGDDGWLLAWIEEVEEAKRTGGCVLVLLSGPESQMQSAEKKIADSNGLHTVQIEYTRLPDSEAFAFDEACRSRLVRALQEWECSSEEGLPALQRRAKLSAESLDSSISNIRAKFDGTMSHMSLRSLYLRPLFEVIQVPDSSCSWQSEWPHISLKHNLMLVESGVKLDPKLLTLESLADRDSIERNVNKYAEDIRERMEYCRFTREEAEAFTLLSSKRGALAAALQEGDSCFAASIYKLTNLLCTRATQQTGIALPCYRHFEGKASLTALDKRWCQLLTPDRNGFLGITCSAVTEGWRNPGCFVADGFRHAYKTAQTTGLQFTEPIASDIVCFVSAESADGLMHTGIVTDRDRVTFPPHTLFRLREIRESGTWEVEVEGVDIRPKQRLLVVTATYCKPHAASGILLEKKHCGDSRHLSYGGRDAFIKGIDDLQPVLTIAQEFDRHLSWTDWKGQKYSLQAEYAYVNGVAGTKEHCTPGTRDAEHDGWPLQRFVDETNEFVRARRAAGFGKGLPESHALLTIDEVVSVRLYSGPSYQVINQFLREVAGLHGRYRAALVNHPSFTFSATVIHLCGAIRKLAAVATPEEAVRPLWRGVRGSLPPGFLVPDEQGLVVATDNAFMSTSTDRNTPLSYMSEVDSNVLWQLTPRPESDYAFHYGADISRISQFSTEAEILFPPCTMLTVRLAEPRKHWGPTPDDGKEFIEVPVTPSFI